MSAEAALPEPESESAHGGGGGAGTTTGGRGTTDDDHGRGRWLARLLAALERLLSREVNVLPYITSKEAARAAASRRTELEAALRRGEQAFHEVPPGLRRPGLHESDSAAAAIAMEWQVEDNLLLLLARVTDYVRTVLADDRLRPMIILEPLRRRVADLEPDLLGWRVVVRTAKPRYVRRQLRKADLSPGIGLDVARAVPPRAQNSCRQGDGRRGIAPGRLHGSGAVTFQTTCAHVVHAACECAVWPPQHVSSAYAGPDAVLLRKGSCLDRQTETERQFVPARKDEWRLLGRNPQMLRLGPSSGNRQGTLRGPMMGFDHEDGWCEMLSLAIEPRRRRYGIVPWPLVKRGFSRDGDSGDWIVGGTENSVWMGMVVQGSSSMTIAHQAPALIEYFDRELGRSSATRLVPDICSYVAP